MTTELSMVLLIQQVSVRDYVTNRDPVSGTAFLFMLGLFALMPIIVGARQTRLI